MGLELSKLAHSQPRAVWANGRGGVIYCVHLTFSELITSQVRV